MKLTVTTNNNKYEFDNFETIINNETRNEVVVLFKRDDHLQEARIPLDEIIDVDFNIAA